MKDWKGNGGGIRTRLTIKKDHTTKGRDDSDFYATDPRALELLLDHCSCFLRGMLGACNRHIGGAMRYPQYGFIRRWNWHYEGKDYPCVDMEHPNIWECAAGVGNLAKVLNGRGFYCFPSDIVDRGGYAPKKMQEIDFLKTEQSFMRKYNFGVILTSPPYRYATEFVEHALKILPKNGCYIALMNLCYLAGQERFRRIYQFGELREVYVFSKRVECWRNNDREQYGGKAMADYAWYVFQKGYAGQPTLYWL